MAQLFEADNTPNKLSPQISKDEATSPLRQTTVVSDTIQEVPETLKTSKRTLTNHDAKGSEPDLSKSKSNIQSFSETSASHIMNPKKIIHVPKIDLNKSRRISAHKIKASQVVPPLPISKLSKPLIQ